ncbi:TetR/AcrR family transcriptional regulator [Streptomyces sp. JJ38]|uniref:TetR/AcrR family transcriptional regulator n=1 Tax=Streptomyces sp. JJ38 TaxID=2738128 RepID=UPI001C57AF6C|nr:TetR/AcrR family transcriptional regulator [Streptomyces sp. JJ38]MBW1597109.1 TetR/AcrR family transcriptional regulator [Streptomyces sp. JJ38]
MPSAREALLIAAQTALADQPWATVRMVEVAAAAGVSRQTLYNEFRTKEGLGAALVDRQIDGLVTGAADAVTAARRLGGDPAACCAAAAVWMLDRAREEPLLRAALTGFWDSRLPLPEHRPEQVVARLCATTMDALCGTREAELRRACEVGLRLALSYVVVPPADPAAPAGVAAVVAALLRGTPAGTPVD